MYDIGRLRGLIAIQQRIGEARGDLDTVMKAIVDEVSVMPQYNGIVVELRDGDQLYYAAASGNSAASLGLRLPLNASLSGLSILTGKPLYCSDAHHDVRVNREACDRVGLRSMIVVPIPHRGRTVGVLKYHSADVDAFDEEDMLVAHLLVGPLAVGFSSVAEADAIQAQTDLQSVVELQEQLVSSVSHELRTPITSILGSLALVRSGAAGVLSEKLAPLIDVAVRNAERLKRLVNDLLDLDKLATGRMDMTLGQTDLGDVLQTVVEENGPFAEMAHVALALDAAPIRLTTDGERLIQAVTNLVSNAVKFAPAGSTVRIATDIAGDVARIRVSDEGPGVPEEFRPRLFDRFSQAKHVRSVTNLPGTGLGLAIAKGIVEQLGGTISLDESVAKGATFEIALPLSTDVALASSAPAR